MISFTAHVTEWGIEEVGQWLESIGLPEYKENFMTNDIRGRELLHLGRQDLKVGRFFVVMVVSWLPCLPTSQPPRTPKGLHASHLLKPVNLLKNIYY